MALIFSASLFSLSLHVSIFIFIFIPLIFLSSAISKRRSDSKSERILIEIYKLSVWINKGVRLWVVSPIRAARMSVKRRFRFYTQLV